jgi:CRISPR-associated protein Cmr4
VREELAIVFVHALTPLHPGTGQGIGPIDLPVARERATGIPYVPGSSLKGVLRDLGRGRLSADRLRALFGPDTGEAHEHAGTLAVGDARLLLFPVRSVAGTFACATSPYLLTRFVREAGWTGLRHPHPLPEPAGPDRCLVAPGSKLLVSQDSRRHVYLEDLDLTAEESEGVRAWEEWLARPTGAPVADRLCLLHDDLMGFLLETATEIVARVQLEDDRKTVAQGALWYEESLPAETLLYSLFRLAPPPGLGVNVRMGDVAGLLGVVQLGGKASVGRGLCRLAMGELAHADA